jgi:energy-coupling factor transporter ATP-binding protein EcfA2
MRLTSFTLEKYGNFACAKLALDPRPGRINPVVGPNGGGKTVLRQAFHDLLLAFRARPRWPFYTVIRGCTSLPRGSIRAASPSRSGDIRALETLSWTPPATTALLIRVAVAAAVAAFSQGAMARRVVNGTYLTAAAAAVEELAGMVVQTRMVATEEATEEVVELALLVGPGGETEGPVRTA